MRLTLRHRAALVHVRAGFPGRPRRRRRCRRGVPRSGSPLAPLLRLRLRQRGRRLRRLPREADQFELQIARGVQGGRMAFRPRPAVRLHGPPTVRAPAGDRGEQDEWAHFETLPSVKRSSTRGGPSAPTCKAAWHRARPPAQPDLQQPAPGGPGVGGQPDPGDKWLRVHRTTGLRVVPREVALSRRGRVLELVQDGGVRPYADLVPRANERRQEWGLRVGLGWQPFADSRPSRRRPRRRATRDGQAPAAAARRRPPRRLGRAPELGLGHRGDARHQLRRVDVQRVRPLRELQPDQPAQLLGQPGRRLHLRRQRVPDQPAHPSLQRRPRTTTRPARTASASGAPR